ncbi:MAG: glycosyltransferase [Verrucomicrobia bacterium]|nr:glycosyltransferase [Verrucomicrobiota bacterium]
MCFSADLINRFCHEQAITCASVRGNLRENYKYDYGIPGLALAFLHMQILKKIDQVTALSYAMAQQLSECLGRLPVVIGNFVDEAPLEVFRARRASGAGVRIVFVGNLSRRKRPDLAVKAIEVLGPSTRLDVIGDGPLRFELEKMVKKNSYSEQVIFHSHLPQPWSLVAKADALVLPSASEGIARAALEALYLGVPCVLRDVDGNRELIRPGYNGALFNNVKDLPAAIRAAVAINDRALGQKRVSLLPEAFRQEYNVSKYLHLIEKKG